MDKKLERALRRAIALLDKHKYRYAVIGGIAYQFWGFPRLTIDVDLKVLVPQTDYPTVRKLIRAAFPERGRPKMPSDPLVVDAVVGKTIVDFLLAMPGYEENIITRAVKRDLGGFKIWICSAEDLIIQKVIAHRAKDWLDVEGVLVTQENKLDFIYIEDWVKQFAELLEEPEILGKYLETRNSVRTILGKRKKSGRV